MWSEPILPPDLTDVEALRIYLTQLNEWIKYIKAENE
jgi:hypothetical protein